ncbi:hypothetical protein EYF80_040280 [Liparis tanakae]|uniref:Uncharacterized protein n=1 Tax=Liparis tanakae TaxID=230148 RepID=A0A4Z2G8R3_9TELE|nr:hypothetical protein EYF80_040280 [Liparis tanakae]
MVRTEFTTEEAVEDDEDNGLASGPEGIEMAPLTGGKKRRALYGTGASQSYSCLSQHFFYEYHLARQSNT